MTGNAIYMIRNGEFGTNFELKLFLTALGLIICFLDWHTQKRNDYFWVFLFGSFVWFLVELGIQLNAVRVMPQHYLFGHPIPTWISALLRGTSEGGFIAMVGLLFGDRISQKETRKRWLIIFAITMVVAVVVTLQQGLAAKAIAGDVASRRNIFTFPAAAIMIGCIVFDALWLWKTDSVSRRRGIYMVLVMIGFSAIWTTAEYIANTRWIEVGIAGGGFRQANPLLEFSVFTWDVVVEIALLYLPFFAIPSLLKKWGRFWAI